MEPQTNTASPLSAKYIFVLAILLIISSAVGAVVGGKYYPREKASLPASVVAVAPTIQSTSYANTNIPEVHTISGKVTSINGSTFTVRDVLAKAQGDASTDRMIVINSDTKIQKGAVGDESLFLTQLNTYMKNIEDTKKNPVLSLPPEMINYADARPEDIKTGVEVFVTTIESIGSQSMLLASKVQIVPELKRLPPPKK